MDLFYFVLVNFLILFFRCCHDILHSLAVKIRDVSRCSCLWLPLSFHAVTSARNTYDSLSLELFPLYACDRHCIRSSAPPFKVDTKRASPYKLVRFMPDGSYVPLLTPSQCQRLITSEVPTSDPVSTESLTVSSEAGTLDSAMLPGVVFTNSSVKSEISSSSVGSPVVSSVQFTNLP